MFINLYSSLYLLFLSDVSKILIWSSVISLNESIINNVYNITESNTYMKSQDQIRFSYPLLNTISTTFCSFPVKIKRQQTIWPSQNKDNQRWFLSIFAKVAAFSFPLGMEEEKRCHILKIIYFGNIFLRMQREFLLE